jgi:hypothetical protein
MGIAYMHQRSATLDRYGGPSTSKDLLNKSNQSIAFLEMAGTAAASER